RLWLVLSRAAAFVCVSRRRSRTSRSSRLNASFISIYCISASDRFRNSCTVLSSHPAASNRRLFSDFIFVLLWRPRHSGAVAVGNCQLSYVGSFVFSFRTPPPLGSRRYQFDT